MEKKKMTMKDVKKDPMLSLMFQVETIHQMSSSFLIEFQRLIEMELNDRKYLKKKNWIERMFNKMGGY